MWETVPRELSGQKGSRENRALQERSTTIHRTWRKKFLDKLHAAGLHMEKVPRDLTFSLLHQPLLRDDGIAPWPQ